MFVVQHESSTASFAIKIARSCSSKAKLERELFGLQSSTGLRHIIQLAPPLCTNSRTGVWEVDGIARGLLMEHVLNLSLIHI